MSSLLLLLAAERRAALLHHLHALGLREAKSAEEAPTLSVVDLALHPMPPGLVLAITHVEGEDARIQALEAGAADAVSPSTSARELAQRARAMLRRNAPKPPLALPQVQEPLSPLEERILALLASEPRTWRREELVSRAWEGPASDRAVDTAIKRLRKKLVGARIRTLRGVGHRLMS